MARGEISARQRKRSGAGSDFALQRTPDEHANNKQHYTSVQVAAPGASASRRRRRRHSINEPDTFALWPIDVARADSTAGQ